jgi:hypothetical protein
MIDNHFAVVFKVDRDKPAIFEGTEEEVYKWLGRVERHSIWEIWDRSMGDYETPEEFLRRVGDKYKPKPQLTEDDVRRIIREELDKFLEAAYEAARNEASEISRQTTGDEKE